jgi:thymidylate synthase
MILLVPQSQECYEDAIITSFFGYLPVKYEYNHIDLNTCLSDVKNTHLIIDDMCKVSIETRDIITYRCVVIYKTKTCTLFNILSEEKMYLNLMKDTLDDNIHSKTNDRTSVGTYSTFAKRLTFSLRNDVIPLMTTKHVFFRGVAEELLWFISGSTDSDILSSRNVKIWDLNGSRRVLDAMGFWDRKEGDLGPVYGFQWRHWGAEYVDKDTVSLKGIDQIKNVINSIKTNPNSRRHVVSAWNVSDLEKMALPPCHICFQFYVKDNEYLSCQMYQRSADLFLGVPFNIASYSLLTHIIAKLTNLKPDKLTMVFGDCHVYSNHIDAVYEQCSRDVLTNFPTLSMDTLNDIDSICMDNLKVINYIHQQPISAPMAV